MTPDSTAQARLILPEAAPALAEQLASGRPIAWQEPVPMTTYEPAAPSRFPMFLEQRVYQGSSGRVYPLPLIEHIAEEPSVREWQAVHLENEYLRLMVLPELGGRIHVGLDKTNGYDFFYRNNVIKPALVGLAGPWISGGVEFNWPQHHRPATYLPVETTIETDADGTVTVWCADHDPFTRMASCHGVRLRPGSSRVELLVRLHNRSSQRQSFLWWANVAVRVHDGYQSFFPEDVSFVADHARRAITAFPRADRPYYGVDYPARAATEPGADRIDFYRNIPVPTSYMIVDSEQDFFGGYDHHAQAGLVHWAERRISPGKKQWTWGNAPFGHAWDDQLTDTDGPYIELMAGVYTDNQPDFSWILPGETKTFTQYWYPIPGIGPAHHASPDAAVHVDRTDGIEARFAVTSPQLGATLRVLDDDRVIAQVTRDLEPGMVAAITATPTGHPAVELCAADGSVLVRWTPSPVRPDEPWVAEQPPQPSDIDTVEELYLTGLHLAQYRHPTRSPIPYWQEALRRDPGDSRTNLALADLDYRAGNYRQARARIDAALGRITRRNTNPVDAEAFYLSGLVHQRLGNVAAAEAHFGKAGWDATWAGPAGLELARSLASRGDNHAALRVLDSLAGVASHDPRRTAVHVIVLRRLGHRDQADQLLTRALALDPLAATLRALAGREVGEDAGLLIDIAQDLARAGEPDSAVEYLHRAAAAPITSAGNHRPAAHYLASAIQARSGRLDLAAEERAAARAASAELAFAHGLDQLDALTAAVDAEPDDHTARALLGNLLYDNGRRIEATEAWNRAVNLGRHDPVLFRNAALGAYNVTKDPDRAWQLYEAAITLAPDDARLRLEQDQLAMQLGHTTHERLRRLSDAETVVLQRDDLTVTYLGLLTQHGEAQRALEILTSRQFRPWEGGEGRVLDAWDRARSALGLPRVDPPANLGEARPAVPPPDVRNQDGETDYFATSLPELLLFGGA